MSYIGNTTQNQNYVPAVDYFNGDGSTVAFTLSRPVASVAAVQAVINNVPQNPGTAFTVSGSTITFTSAPSSGTNNIYVYYTSPNTQVIQPGQGTVGTAQLATDLTLTNPTYTGTLTGGTGVVNIGSGQMYKDSSGNVGIGTSSPQRKLDVTVSDTSTSQLYLRNNNASYAAGMVVYNAGGEASMFRHNGASDTSYGGANSLNIGTITNNNFAFVTNNTERMRIDSSGNLIVNGTNPNAAGAPCQLSVQYTQSGHYGMFIRNTGGNSSSYAILFENTNGTIGTITTSGSTTTYNTSSDYRLKENIQPMQNALGVVAQLNPVTYTWKADGSDGQGFIAHELQAVVPDCVTGEKDAVDADGKPVYQGIDTSFLVATLCKAIQELKAEVDDLKAQLEAK